MLATARLRGLIFFVTLFAINGCRQKAEPKKELLPSPASHTSIPDRIAGPLLDKSPMDMAYYPEDYPILKMSDKTTAPPIARVIYSRPEKDGRIIFGKVVKYNERWRLGANEATEIEFFKDVVIQDKKVKKGRYILYCVPFPRKWTLILNDDLFVWGLKIHSSRDVYSFDVPVVTPASTYEVLTMEFIPLKNGMRLSMAWDNVQAFLPISF